jgi:hypothetical protein
VVDGDGLRQSAQVGEPVERRGDAIFRVGWSVQSAPPRPAMVQPPLGPPPTDDEMVEQY